MASTVLKQTIVKAILKVAEENPALNLDGREAFEEARDDFIRLLMKELFPECPDVVLPTDADRVTIPTPDPVDALAEQVKTLKIEPEKKKPAPRKPKAKKEEAPVNLAKLDATQSKQLTAVAKQMKVKADKKAFLEYINKLTPEEYNAEGVKLEDHMRKFMTPAPTATPEPVVEKKEEQPTELVQVEFEGEEYYVEEVSKRVYRPVGEWKDGQPAGWEKVGYVGMANFKDMVIPPPDDE